MKLKASATSWMRGWVCLSLVLSSTDLSLCSTSAGTLALGSAAPNPTCSNWALSVLGL